MSDRLSSPAASIEAGTATNPNTPRSGDGDASVGDLRPDDQNIISNGQAANDVTSDCSSQSDLSSRQAHDIQPTWPSRIDRAKIPACACWHLDQKIRDISLDDSGSFDHNINDISLDIHWAPKDNRAFFKLHTRLHLKGAPGSSRRGSNVYIFIYPERIHQLSFNAEPLYSPLPRPAVKFTFKFNRPPALILPKSTGLEQGAESAMHSLRSLIQQSYLTVYTRLPAREFPTTWLQRLCEDVTEHKLTTIASLANLKTLYQGSDGQLIEGDSLLEEVSNQDATAQELPVYQETDPSIPLARSAKRKRLCKESFTIGQAVQSADTVEAKLAARERSLAKRERSLAKRERSLAKREHSLAKRERKLAKRESDDIADRMKSVGERVRDDVVDGLEDVIDEKMLQKTEEVQEYVMEQIASMPVEARFTFPNHSYL
ncbi:hypothetical protein ACHAQJ_007441 [Trichoderma viride]